MNDSRQTVTTTAGDELSVSQAVLETVAEATGRDTTELSPLYRAIDPESLDALLESRPARTGGPLVVAFDYSGCRVSVERRNDGTVGVTASEEGSSVTACDESE